MKPQAVPRDGLRTAACNLEQKRNVYPFATGHRGADWTASDVYEVGLL